ncbi:hypothetical protein COCVIDRAFT_90067, partial [Bipolaris victoriae FI3]
HFCLSLRYQQYLAKVGVTISEPCIYPATVNSLKIAKSLHIQLLNGHYCLCPGERASQSSSIL